MQSMEENAQDYAGNPEALREAQERTRSNTMVRFLESDQGHSSRTAGLMETTARQSRGLALMAVDAMQGRDVEASYSRTTPCLFFL